MSQQYPTDHPFRRPVSECALTGETLRPTALPNEGAVAARPFPTVRMLSINYCVGEDDNVTTLIMELRPSSMQKIYALFRIVNVIHLNIVEMTREEFSSLEEVTA